MCPEKELWVLRERNISEVLLYSGKSQHVDRYNFEIEDLFSGAEFGLQNGTVCYSVV